MKKNEINPTNGEFTQIFIDKGNLTTEQIEELLLQYFHKKENILNRKLTAEEKLTLAIVFYAAIEEGKCNPAVIMEFMLPSTNKPFTENENPQIQFRKPKRYE